MLGLLLATELIDMPLFVARNLANLTPLSADNCDMNTILQELDSMKCHVQHLTDSQSDNVIFLKAANLFEKEATVYKETVCSSTVNTSQSLTSREDIHHSPVPSDGEEKNGLRKEGVEEGMGHHVGHNTQTERMRTLHEKVTLLSLQHPATTTLHRMCFIVTQNFLQRGLQLMLQHFITECTAYKSLRVNALM